MRRAMMIGWLLACGAASAKGQSMAMPMDQAHPATPVPLTQHARDQIAEAKRVASLLDTPEKARAAGYHPRFGDVPLQGIHYSNPALVLSGTFDIEHPPTLMFIPVNGEQRLVGVAYTYELKDGAPMPDGFDGAAMWHEHPALSLPGHRLVMTHVWFIASPNGPFAHDNPMVSFLERNMTYPPPGWLDPATTRKLALALAFGQRQMPGSGRRSLGVRSDSLVQLLAVQRDTIDRQATELEGLLHAGKQHEYRALATVMGNEGDGMVATIKEIPADSLTRAVLSRLLDEALTDHMAKP